MFGRKLNTKTNRLTALFIIVFLAGIMLYFINSNEKIGSWEYRIIGTVQSLLYLILIAAWCGLTRHRLIQRGLRKYISLTCLFLMLWIVLRGLKYYIFAPGTDAARYCWYAYYIPLMFYPACVLTAVLHIGKPDDWKLPRNKVLIFLIPAVIVLIVLTNDLHQLIFFFPSDSITWSDFDYRRGILYALPFSWYSVCVLLSLSVMIKRYRIPQIHRISTKILLLPSVFGVIYDLQYVTEHALFFSDIIVVLCALTVLTFESAIRVGYIRSNSHYLDTFRQSSVAARIYDKDGHLKYRSGSSDFYETDLPDQIFDQGSYIRDDIRYRFQRITNGYVVWQENISELLQIQKQLESANEYLQDKNLILRRQYETKIERRRL
ncbi:MAG: histidine kinase N-terminal 7TM domain-containing protein, partial [Lachnospiraceae bacterium]|nr:histidine kinase N-terminal 7TM domain-containing protein [Lachnospiraceae bacterium]